MTERIEDERRLMGTMVRLCAEKLEQRRHHGRWLPSSWLEVYHRASEEQEELSEAVDHHIVALSEASKERTRDAVIGECVDVALTAMMLADKLLLEGVE